MKFILNAAILFVIFASAIGIDRMLHYAVASAQQVERERPIQQTTIGIERGKTPDNVQLHVIDLAHVCVYIVHDSISQSSGGHATGITAIPKTQLPQGAGCQ